LPDPDESRPLILKIAKEIKLARKLARFKCPQGEAGCHACRPLERILRREATFVGVNEYNQDIYVFEDKKEDTLAESEIL
jgi:hypothetical protein